MDKPRFGYMQRLESKIIKREHCISYWDGIWAQSLKASLASVPDDAILYDVEENGSDTVLVFIEESQVK